MNRKEEMIELDDVDIDIHEEEYDFEEEKPKPHMIIIVFLEVVIVLATIICSVFLIFKSGEDNEEDYVSSVESEVEVTVTEEEQEDRTETEIIENNEKQESLSVVEENVQSEEADVQEEPVSGNELMEFEEISDTVTAKDVTNLRTVPSTLDEENIVSQLLNGETVSRTGINDVTGWSRLDYNGQIVYAVSGYLTTDLDYKPPVAPSDPNRVATQDGRVIIFQNIDDYVTPKEYVNLRVEPSTSEGESTVRCQINNGDTVHRTGYSPDSGWSRVEYNGEILYVVSSMIYSKEAVTE